MKQLSICIILLVLTACGEAPQKKRDMLFNGDNLSGWEMAVMPGADMQQATELFRAEQGNIKIAGEPFGYLYTVEQHSVYKLHFEWRWVGEPTNSGVFIHVQNPGDVWPRAYEFQLMAGHAGDMVMLGGAKLEDFPCEGEFPIKPREGDYENAAGEWNTGEIVVNGPFLEYYVNGHLQNQATAKFETGHIALQSEGGPLELRNIYLEAIE
ncbi:MAG: DUF1080 domain-containing protein [Alistipes sp.]|nr:DUF1080 domain-containing protein [Alistipes sp.]